MIRMPGAKSNRSARQALIISAMLGLTAFFFAVAPRRADAFVVYNNTSRTLNAQVTGGNFNKNIKATRSAACNYKEKSCNRSRKRETLRSADIEIGTFVCRVRLKAGGWVSVYEHRRSYGGLTIPGPPEYQCVSRFKAKTETVTDKEPSRVGETTRNVTFLATADAQYNNADGQFAGHSNPNWTLRAINGILSGPNVRGALNAGDQTQNSRPIDEYMWYRHAIDGLGSSTPDPHYLTHHDVYYPPNPGGVNRLYFDTVGNHDGHSPGAHSTQQTACGTDPPLSSCMDPESISNEIRTRKRVTPITKQGTRYGRGLYSWDWHDVHFVNTGVFAGNAKPTGPQSGGACGVQLGGKCRRIRFTYPGPDPGRALDFLKEDLMENVGNSGRPVIISQHYGFDGFSTGEACQDIENMTPPTCKREVWWNEAQREALWDVIAPYNVVAFYTGHAHNKPGQWMLYPFKRPATRTNGPAEIPAYVAGAALNRVFLYVVISDNVGCSPKAGETCLLTAPFAAYATGHTLAGSPDLRAIKVRDVRKSP